MITRLDVLSARKISAGQVITDPASVLKELLENSLDAGATHVTIRLKRFGLDEMEVEDDGCGIPMEGVVDTRTGRLREGATTPLLRSRATTKRSQQQEQEEESEGGDGSSHNSHSGGSGAQQLGFRGEALHSLAQFSRVTVRTCHPPTTGSHTVTLTCDPSAAAPNSPAAVALEVSAPTAAAAAGAGTTVTAQHLFQHLPVRLRELEKNARKKLLAAVQLVKQYAVSHPHVRILMTHQEDPARQSALVTLVSLSGSRDLSRSVAEAYGAQCLTTMEAVDWTAADYCEAVTGLLSKVGGGGRTTADRQIIALDGRLVDLPRIKKAINDAFQQCLPNASQRLSAAFFLQVQTNKNKLAYDVNVNPDKRKVIFADEEGFAAQMYRLALKDLQTSAERVELDRPAREAQHRVEDQRLEALIKERRTPVSATAFTQFVFKREPVAATDLVLGEGSGSGGELGGGDSLPTPGEPALDAMTEENRHIARLSAELLRGSAAALTAAAKEQEGEQQQTNGEEEVEEQQLLANSSSSEEEMMEETVSEATKEGTRRRRAREVGEEEDEGDDNQSPTASTSEGSAPKKVKLSAGGSEGEGETADVGRVSVLSDITNGLREEGYCQCGLPFPALDHLRAEPPLSLLSSPALHHKTASATTAAAAAGVPGKDLGAQTEKDLTEMFQKRSFKDMKIIGQFNHGFILARHERDLFIIDQHASDEIYNYERHLKQYKATPQRLVVPAVVTMDGHEVELALSHADLLLEHGFQVSASTTTTSTSSLSPLVVEGEGEAEVMPTQLLVHTVPVLPYDTVHPTDIQELVQQLVLFHTITRPLRAVWHSLATKACRGSIMIGTALSERTMRQMVDRLGELEKPWNCPHGRPTMRHLLRLPPSPDF